MNAAIFLDRDNTLIHNDGDLGDPDGVELCQGAPAAIESFRKLGYKIVVVTNQGGVARGKFTCGDVEAVHQKINTLLKERSGLGVDRFYYCPYHPEGTVGEFKSDHAWRKPKPGMLLQAAKDLKLDLRRCWMIGDQMRDVQAGAEVGARTMWLQIKSQGSSGQPTYAPKLSDSRSTVKPDHIVHSLHEAVTIVTSAPSKKKAPSLTTPTAVPDLRVTASQDLSDTVSQGPVEPIEAEEGSRDESRASSGSMSSRAQSSATDQNNGSDASRIPADQTLREILQELRNQRSLAKDFSYTTVLAIVVQMVAIVCLIGALLLGTEAAAFMRWISVAVFLELTTVAILRFRR